MYFFRFWRRVNTFRRLDLLGIFLEHYHKCQNVRQIQIIWSDQESTPPLEWLNKYPKDKVAFEVHRNNSLNNRFRNLLPITTEVNILRILSCKHILIFITTCLGLSLCIDRLRRKIRWGEDAFWYLNLHKLFITGDSVYRRWSCYSLCDIRQCGSGVDVQQKCFSWILSTDDHLRYNYRWS